MNPIRIKKELRDLNCHVGSRRGRWAEQDFGFPRDIRPSCRGAALIRREQRHRRVVYMAMWLIWAVAFVILVWVAGSGW